MRDKEDREKMSIRKKIKEWRNKENKCKIWDDNGNMSVLRSNRNSLCWEIWQSVKKRSNSERKKKEIAPRRYRKVTAENDR